MIWPAAFHMFGDGHWICLQTPKSHSHDVLNDRFSHALSMLFVGHCWHQQVGNDDGTGRAPTGH